MRGLGVRTTVNTKNLEALLEIIRGDAEFTAEHVDHHVWCDALLEIKAIKEHSCFACDARPGKVYTVDPTREQVLERQVDELIRALGRMAR